MTELNATVVDCENDNNNNKNRSNANQITCHSSNPSARMFVIALIENRKKSCAYHLHLQITAELQTKYSSIL